MRFRPIGSSPLKRIAAAGLPAAWLCLAPAAAPAQTYDTSGQIIPRNPMRAANDSTINIEVHPLRPGVFAAKNRFIWNGWVELPEGILVIDGGYDARSARALADTIRARSGPKPFRYLVLTNSHVDHVGGVRTFASLGATVLAHPDVVRAIRDSLPPEASGGAAPDQPKPSPPAKGAKGRGRAGAPAATRPTGPLHEVKDRAILGPADRRVEISWLGKPAYSTGDLVIRLPKQRVLFTGDLAWNRSVPWIVDPSFSLNGWVASIDSLLRPGFDADSVVPGHGKIGKRMDVLMFTRRYLTDAFEKVASRASWGIPIKDIDEWGYLGAYEDCEFYDPIHYYNMRRLYQLSQGVKTPGRARPGVVKPR